jgi:hypothetical protein
MPDPLPDLELFRSNGSTVRLSELISRPTLAIALRHLA